MYNALSVLYCTCTCVYIMKPQFVLYHAAPLFGPWFGGLSAQQLAALSRDGHLLLPSLLTQAATEQLVASIQQVGALGGPWKAVNRPISELAELRALQSQLEHQQGGGYPHGARSGFAEQVAVTAFEQQSVGLLQRAERPHLVLISLLFITIHVIVVCISGRCSCSETSAPVRAPSGSGQRSMPGSL